MYCTMYFGEYIYKVMQQGPYTIKNNLFFRIDGKTNQIIWAQERPRCHYICNLFDLNTAKVAAIIVATYCAHEVQYGSSIGTKEEEKQVTTNHVNCAEELVVCAILRLTVLAHFFILTCIYTDRLPLCCYLLRAAKFSLNACLLFGILTVIVVETKDARLTRYRVSLNNYWNRCQVIVILCCVKFIVLAGRQILCQGSGECASKSRIPRHEAVEETK